MLGLKKNFGNRYRFPSSPHFLLNVPTEIMEEDEDDEEALLTYANKLAFHLSDEDDELSGVELERRLRRANLDEHETWKQSQAEWKERHRRKTIRSNDTRMPAIARTGHTRLGLSMALGSPPERTGGWTQRERKTPRNNRSCSDAGIYRSISSNMSVREKRLIVDGGRSGIGMLRYKQGGKTMRKY